MNTIQRLAVAATLGLSAAGAMATTYAIGPLPIAPSSYTQVATEGVLTSFTDKYTFTLAASETVYGAVSSVDLPPLFNVGALTLTLWNGTGSTLLATGTGSGEDSTIANVLLGPGSYFFSVAGTSSGSSGGFTAFVASATPVPEPGTYALMLAGVAVIGFVALRRRD